MAGRRKTNTAAREIVIVGGVRTPMGKVGGVFEYLSAVDLGVLAVRELLARAPVSRDVVDSVIVGNVIQPADATNIARVIALMSGVPRAVPAHTVHRNCASGMQAITDAAEKILAGRAEVVVAGGVESMTHAPLLFHDEFRRAMAKWPRARNVQKKVSVMMELIKAPWKPRVSLMEGLTDPTIRQGMGDTAENLARDFSITRREQDDFALASHQKAAQSWRDGWYEDEVMHMFAPPSYIDVHQDEGIRAEQTMEALSKLRPAFDKELGSVTAGNSSQITDGACMVLMTHREKAESEGWPVLGYLHDWGYTGCDPSRMGLGPVFASHQLMQRAGLSLADMQRVELNEAFAAQVLACQKALASKSFAEHRLGQSQAIGAIDEDRLNVHGGAVAMGHPVGMSGTRLIFTLMRQLKQEANGLGLATLCIGGGQGGAVLVGSEPWKS